MLRVEVNTPAVSVTRAIKAGIPLIIGSAGTSGSDAGLAWMRIPGEVARESAMMSPSIPI
jgi:hypothetical protein